jgi:predicted secreted hydrolase
MKKKWRQIQFSEIPCTKGHRITCVKDMIVPMNKETCLSQQDCRSRSITPIQSGKVPPVCAVKGQKRPEILLAAILAFMLTSCAFPGMVSTAQQLPPARPTPQATALPPIHFPQDEGAHNDLTEWWYYTGHLMATDSQGKSHQYGFEFVIFQALRSDLPPVYTSHFAISDITRGQFYYDQRSLIEAVPTPDGNSTRGIDVQVGNWSMRGIQGQDHLIASMQKYAIDLHLSALTPAVLHNGNGIITFGTAGFSYYYSRPRMAVSGTISDHQQSLSVKGQAWMDHQWGNFLALGGGGWDWYSIQLNNNTELMLYFIRNAAGQIESTYGDYVSADGQDRLLAARSIQATALAHWTSPQTGATYPSGWRLTIDDSQWQGSLTLTPQLKDQELNVCQSSGTVYWEGAVSIAGQADGQAINGEGYVELTGYPTNVCQKKLTN